VGFLSLLAHHLTFNSILQAAISRHRTDPIKPPGGGDKREA